MATIIKNGKRWRAQVWREQIRYFFDSSRRKKMGRNARKTA
ncbi:putative pyruvate kinase [Haemophilus influenzae]|nr:putative pyruvate kinase [Haemophilus influenzae]